MSCGPSTRRSGLRMPASALSEPAECISAARRRGALALTTVSDTPGLDADLLLAHVLGVERTALFTHSRDDVSLATWRRFQILLEGRLHGTPVAYLLGRKAFRSIELMVDSRVLVPRPETEQLVDIALAKIRARRGPMRVLDVGMGSGAIALALAYETADRAAELEIVGSDLSYDALQVAASNRDALGLASRVQFFESDLLDDVAGSFDLILANLPYLRHEQRHTSTAAEPELALFAGEDGFDVYRRFLPQAAVRLRPKGLIAVEIDPSQADFGALEAANSTGLPVEVRCDLAGRQRFLLIGDTG